MKEYSTLTHRQTEFTFYLPQASRWSYTLQMETLHHLQNIDDNVRLTALTKIAECLRDQNLLTDSNQLQELMSRTLTMLKDSNSAIVLQAFDCLELLLEHHGDTFQPVLNITFDAISSNLGNSKLSLRVRASEIMFQLVNLFGLSSGFDKLSVLMEKENSLAKEQILNVVSRLCDFYKEDMMFAPNVASKIASLLHDHSMTVQKLALGCLWKLSLIFGNNSIMVSLSPHLSLFDHIDSDLFLINEIYIKTIF